MRHRTAILAVALLLWGALASWADEPPSGGVKFVPPRVETGPTSVEDLLRQAATLEQQQRWSEALQIYQDAQRAYPDNHEVGDRRVIAQIHFDVNRRCADQHFQQALSRSTTAQALATYSDVIHKVQTYYVIQPDWKSMVRLGASDLQIALQHPNFVQRYAGDLSAERAAEVAAQLPTWIAAARIEDAQDAYRITQQLAVRLHEQAGVSQVATIYEMIFGLVQALDPYSAYMTDSQYRETMSQIEGNFVGLGVELKTLPGQLVVVSVIPNGPAYAAGLQSGDLILSADGVSVEQTGSEVVADALRGAEGSSCELVVQRDLKAYRASVVRRHVEIPSLSDTRMLDPDAGIAYIRIGSFQRTTIRDFDQAMARLYQQGMRQLVLDLRGNPGGLLTAGVEVADRFISQGIIVATHGRNPMEDFVHHAHPSNTWRIPLVVLIDENSASAAEILAAAIADHKAGRIVGNRSYGKGSVQGIFPLSVGGGLRLTTAKFYAPSGRAIQNSGVTPDVEVTSLSKPATGAPTDSQTDGALAVAVQTLKSTQSR